MCFPFRQSLTSYRLSPFSSIFLKASWSHLRLLRQRCATIYFRCNARLQLALNGFSRRSRTEGKRSRRGSDRQLHECSVASKMRCRQMMKGRGAKLAREEQAMRQNLGIKGKRPAQESSMRWFGLDSDPGNVRRTGRILRCSQEEAAEDGLRNKRLVEERLNRPAPTKRGQD